ncbi:Fic family protein [Pseudenhygromyxa sp. WMMC2535]|uniref:Fic family protein n=1 Tax=Pseudenhygromyxa sp. WMMC2535 TaxID=2712867 RepID=UPI001551874D|nr:Fic family protein [Pseudenhygromyxa sp. WMMC2535]NVB41937.1 Fic family protein [Pseudenhygromyxa sp. WMMC2535]
MSDRESVPEQSAPLPQLSPEERAQLEAENGVRQFDRMMEIIEAGLQGSRFRLRVSTLQNLNREAVQGLEPSAGHVRNHPVSISNTQHQPPEASDVQELLEELCDYVNDHWEEATALHLASYVMWRLNWIHPWGDGNGRTSRVASYLVLCVKTGFVLPGEKTIPEMIADNKSSYYDALDAADASWKQDSLDVSAMESLLEGYLAAQLLSVVAAAGGST